MPRIDRTVLLFICPLLLFTVAGAQTLTQKPPTNTEVSVASPPVKEQPPIQSTIIVAATASRHRVRYVSVGEVNETRLQVFSSDGAQVFDSSFRLGNLVDWNLIDQQGQALADGSYLFLITVKDFSNRLTQRYGTVLLESGQVFVEQSSRDELPAGQAAALEANKLEASLSAIDRIGAVGETQTATVPNDGGTVIDVPQGKKDNKSASSSTTGNNLSGTGTQNMIAKWIDNSGTLGNSIISEVNGQVGIGTSNPQGQLHIFGTATQDVFAGLGPDLINGPALNFGYAGASFGRGAGFFNIRPDASAVAPNPSLRFATANVQRMIITNTGNVGIGTTSPAQKLEVSGNLKISGAGNGLMFPDGTSMATAAVGGGGNITTFRHTRTVASKCGPTGLELEFSFIDNAALNGNPNAMIFVTALVGINSGRTNTNSSQNLQVVYSGSTAFGSCPASRWLIRGGDTSDNAQFTVLVSQ